MFPLIKMVLLDTLVQNPQVTDSDLVRVMRKYRHLNELEILYGDPSIPLLTQGVELESISRQMVFKFRRALTSLGIAHYRESAVLHEIFINPSYTSWVQGKFLQMIVNLNAVKIDCDYKSQTRKTVSRENESSIHINYGMDSEIKESWLEFKYKGKTDDLVLVLGLAYSSKYRLLNRKTRSAYQVKSDALEMRKYNIITSPLVRLEYRLAEFGDHTYYELTNGQYIMSAYQAWIKREEKIPMTDIEVQMASVLDALFEEIDKLLVYLKPDGSSQGVKISILDDHQYYATDGPLIDMLNDPKYNIQEHARKLIDAKAREIRHIIAPLLRA